MEILVIRENLETGNRTEFNILKNSEFLSTYGHRPGRLYPTFAAELVAKWNRQQPKTWRYTLHIFGH